MMTELIQSALELPIDADLRALCGSNEQPVEIALFDGDQVEDEAVRAQSQQLMESAAMENGQGIEREMGSERRDKEEASGSEEEFQFGDGDGDGDEEDGDPQSERKRKKKEEKRSKKKRKRERKKRKRSERGDGEKRKSSKKKRKSRKRKRVESDSDGEEEGVGGVVATKRRRLNVNAAADGDGGDDEEDFFGDLAGDDSEEQNGKENENVAVEVGASGKEKDGDIRMDSNQVMNTPQIQKFRSLSLGENQNVLNAVAEEMNDAEPVNDEVAPKKSKRRFVSDSDSD